jgi:hypothetical protein
MGSAVVTVRSGIELLESALAESPPGSVDGDGARELASLFARVERLGAAAKALYARSVTAPGGGHHEVAGWLAEVGGVPVGRARDELAVAELVTKVPVLHRAYVAGELSGAEAKVIAGAAAADPRCAGELLAKKACGSFKGLRDHACSVARRARGEEDIERREARAHERRCVRTYEPEGGGIRFDVLLSKVDGARVLSCLEAEAARIFAEQPDTHERRMADALVRLVRPGPGPGAHVVVRVDAGALHRGYVEEEEVCEIPGIGPVPVRVARSLMGDALLTLVVTKGIDVGCVTSTTRTVPRSVRTALSERDRTCVVPGCGISHHLEIDHWRVDFARGGLTRLDNLARLCGRHHSMKTNLGWKLAGGPGRWRWFNPAVRAGPQRSARH